MEDKQNAYNNELNNITKLYKNDNRIIDKLFILLNYYMNKGSWPHTVDDYIKECIHLFQVDPFKLSEYITSNENSMKDLEENLKKDLEFFIGHANEEINNAMIGKSNPLNISTISFTKSNSGETIFNFVRLDNKSFEVAIPSEEEFMSILQYMGSIAEKNFNGK